MWKKIRNIHLSNSFFDYLINIQIFTLFHIHLYYIQFYYYFITYFIGNLLLLLYWKFTLVGNSDISFVS